MGSLLKTAVIFLLGALSGGLWVSNYVAPMPAGSEVALQGERPVESYYEPLAAFEVGSQSVAAQEQAVEAVGDSPLARLAQAQIEMDADRSAWLLDSVRVEVLGWSVEAPLQGDDRAVLEEYLFQRPADLDVHWWQARQALASGDLESARYHALLARTAPHLMAAAEQLLAEFATGQAAGRQALVVPLDRRTNQYLMRATVAGAEAVFLVDTGASVSALSDGFAQRNLSAHYTGRQLLLNTAGGQYRADVVSVEAMQLGDSGVGPLLDVAGRDFVVLSANVLANFDGLLGLDVLAGFDFRIEGEDRQLVLEPL